MRRRQGRRPRAPLAAFDLGGALNSLLGDDEDDYDLELPTAGESVVKGLKESTENALNSAISRLDVEVPLGFVFGQEDRRQGKLLEVALQAKKKSDVKKSNRELARIFVEMLQPIGEGLVVAFPTAKGAGAAKKTWKLSTDEAKVISFPDKGQASFAAEVEGPRAFKQKLKRAGCQCLLVVSPGPAELSLVAEISDEQQDQMGIVLLNARIHGREPNPKIPSRLLAKLQETFLPSYHLRFLKQKSNALIFHACGPEGYEAPWILAKQRELIGESVASDEVARFNGEPTPEQVEEAFEEFSRKEKGLGDKFIDMLEKK